MTIYVQSRGQSQDQDYRWLKIEEDSQIPEIPSILRKAIPTPEGNSVFVTDLIDSQTSSVVLARLNRELFLLVTGLKTREERTDFMGRSVRNSVLWIYSDTEEYERSLRFLAILALRGELDSKVDATIDLGGEYGFVVSPSEFHALAQPEAVDILEADSVRRIGNNCLELRESLALELEQCSLPSHNGLLILVTSLKNKAALSSVGVWRGLSNRIADKEWQSLSSVSSVMTTSSLSPEKKSLLPLSLLLVGVSVLALGIFLFL